MKRPRCRMASQTGRYLLILSMIEDELEVGFSILIWFNHYFTSVESLLDPNIGGDFYKTHLLLKE